MIAKCADPSLVGFLSNIREDHPDMLIFYDSVRDIVRANEQGPRVYLKPMYNYYYTLMSNKLCEMALNIFTQPSIPALRVSIDECTFPTYTSQRTREHIFI